MESKLAAHGRLRLLIASVLLNLLLLLGYLPPISRRQQSTAAGTGGGGGGGGDSPAEVSRGVLPLEPHWTRAAAAEAEAVAAINCSTHGRAFLDGVLAGGEGLPRCECNTCYGGDDCSRLSPDCPADVSSGDPLFLEAYWRRHASASAVVFSGWHRMSYRATGKNYISQELETHVRLLHKVVGNAVTDGKFIVFGAGSTQLLNALVYALSSVDDDDDYNNDSSSSPALVVATAPYYPVYKSQTIMFDGRKYEWEGSTTSGWVQNSTTDLSNSKVIEFVTSPNNPDGGLRQPVVRGARVINDRAYYWPHYSAIPAPADEDIMTFTVSKMSGHAGSRFGWALIKDEKVYERTTRYVELNSMGASRDAQLRVLKLLKAIIGEVDDSIFEFGHKTMKERWRKLQAVVSDSSDRFSLQDLSPRWCSYFNRTRDPSPAYGWVKCEWEEDTDCSAVLKKAGIISRSGTMYESDARYTRLSLLKTEDDMDLLLKRFGALVDSTSNGQGKGNAVAATA